MERVLRRNAKGIQVAPNHRRDPKRRTGKVKDRVCPADTFGQPCPGVIRVEVKIGNGHANPQLFGKRDRKGADRAVFFGHGDDKTTKYRRGDVVRMPLDLGRQLDQSL